VRILHLSSEDLTYLWRGSYISLERILHISGEDLTYLWRGSDISLERILHISGEDLTYLWRGSYISPYNPCSEELSAPLGEETLILTSEELKPLCYVGSRKVQI
jgi:hypothetical protein